MAPKEDTIAAVAPKSNPAAGIMVQGDTVNQEDSSVEAPPVSSLQKVLDAMTLNERGRFLTGSVLVPLLIAVLTIGVGTFIAADYQDWQDRRTRARDIIDGIREATSRLSTNLEALAQRGSAVERIRSKQTVLDEIRAVDESLASLEGMATALESNRNLFSNSKTSHSLKPSIARCKEVTNAYAECLAKAVTPPLSTVEDQQSCTSTFREGISEKASCKSLESTAYTIVY